MLGSIFLQLWKASTKKEALTMEFPLTLWPKWLLHNLLPPSLCSQNTTPWIFFSTMEQVQYKRMQPFLLLDARYLT
jgi:hypothetical protein